MDEGLTEDVAHLDTPDITHLQYKDGEQSLKPGNCETFQPKEMAVQGDTSSPESSFDVLAEILEGKNVNIVDQTENPCPGPQTMNDSSVMVEELTMRNYDGSNVAIVGTSSNREKLQGRQNQFQHLFSMVGGSTGSTSYSERDFNQARASNTSFPESSSQKAISGDNIEPNEHLVNVERNSVSSEMISRGHGIKTKILSKSAFSEYFVKTTLKGKGIIYKGQPHSRFRAHGPEQKSISAGNGPKVASNASVRVSGGPSVAFDASLSSRAKTCYPPSSSAADKDDRVCESEGLSLREWLKSERHKVNKAECLYIFRQIVDLVDYSHSQGVVLYDVRPSCFRMLQGKRVKYIGPGFHREYLDMKKDSFNPENPLVRRRPTELGLPSNFGLSVKKQRFIDNASFSQWPLFQRASIKSEMGSENDGNVAPSPHFHIGSGENSSNTASHPNSCMSEQLEEKWYASPEEISGGICTIPSNIYSLGVLLFELLGRFDSERAREASMSNIRHRILPPDFLSENPKEAGFCLWLLHPEPSSRPTTRDIIQSEAINGVQEMFAEEFSLSIEQEDTASELLLHFLVSLEEKKQKHASKLMDDIQCLEADIEEVEKRRSAIKVKEPSISEGVSPLSSNATPEMRLVRNIRQLESAYFSTRTHAHLPDINHMVRPDRDLLRNCDNFSSAQENVDTKNTSDRVGAFFDGLCKYARYSKFETRGVLRTGELNNSANVICSLGFDRDEDYFAVAGVSKKIKVFEFNALLNDSVDIHYPAIEMPNKSTLSCVRWNNYVKNYLASSDFDGTVKLWDVSTGQAILEFSEHGKRAWSVDFSQVYPTKLASGSDDCSVRLWNINERNCLGTIRNIANVCCVQFSPHSTNLLAFGSADYRTYCYDLRNLRGPWCILTGHDKAVSYVNFLDHETLVTASTDNTLKLWDLKKTTHGGLSSNACSLTFSGHTNEKNFVGLSTFNGYIACGSETNEVYAYYKSLPMPVTSYKFGSIDPISGRETDDDSGLFVSSVCWRKRSDMVVAANSSGFIKVLQMV